MKHTPIKTNPFLLLALLLALFPSCSEKKESTPDTVSIRVIAPEEHDPLPYQEIEVVLTHKNLGTTYTASCSENGTATFCVEQGFYSATAHYQSPSGLIFSGRVDELALLSEREETIADLPLTRSQTNALVIKEIYYGGCIGKQGEEYQSDQYVILYNNSDKVVYLDSLCIAVADPIASTESAWMKYTDMKRIPVNDLAWQFPGNGKDHPLQPGGETVIATNAVNHTGGGYGHPNSIDLSKADWAFWDSALSSQDITAGVKPLVLFSNLNPRLWMYSLPVVGPTLMVFKTEGCSAAAYAANPANRENKPQHPNKKKFYLMVPKEWVIDCVECVENAGIVGYKRVPDDLDSRAAYIADGPYTGEALIRKVSTGKTGRTVYQDTNNSSEDMTATTPTLKQK